MLQWRLICNVFFSLKTIFPENLLRKSSSCYLNSQYRWGFFCNLLFDVMWYGNALIVSLFSLRATCGINFRYCCLWKSSNDKVSLIWYNSLLVILYRQSTTYEEECSSLRSTPFTHSKPFLTTDLKKRWYTSVSLHISKQVWRPALHFYVNLGLTRVSIWLKF